MMILEIFFLTTLVYGQCFTGYQIESSSLYPVITSLQNGVLVPVTDDNGQTRERYVFI